MILNNIKFHQNQRLPLKTVTLQKVVLGPRSEVLEEKGPELTRGGVGGHVGPHRAMCEPGN